MNDNVGNPITNKYHFGDGFFFTSTHKDGDFGDGLCHLRLTYWEGAGRLPGCPGVFGVVATIVTNS